MVKGNETDQRQRREGEVKREIIFLVEGRDLFKCKAEVRKPAMRTVNKKCWRKSGNGLKSLECLFKYASSCTYF